MSRSSSCGNSQRGEEFFHGGGSGEAPLVPSPHKPVHPINPPFPGCVINRLVLFVFDGAHILLAPHVMNAVHSWAPFCGGATLATPTIASRVTSAANASSLKCSLSAGRSGSTR